MREEDSARCEAAARDSLDEAREECAGRDWIPIREFEVETMCYVHSEDAQRVYLDVQEPWEFYLDLVWVGACFVISGTFAVCMLRMHWRTILSWCRLTSQPRVLGRRLSDAIGADLL